jgi:acyl carrier protein
MAALRLTIGDFASYLAGTIGADAASLRPDQPLGSQLAVDSVRMVELAIVLEQEFGIELPDDLDLRGVSVDGLYERYAAAPSPAGPPAGDDRAAGWS